MARRPKWTYRYDYQLAGYLVCRGSLRLVDVFPTREAAAVAVSHLNSGGSIETIPDPESWHEQKEPDR
jgi:hypothetical protein